MLRALALVLIAAAVSLAAVACDDAGDSGVVQVSETDEEMNDAIERARRDVDRFIATLASAPPGLDEPLLKAPLETSHGIEHVWLGSVTYSDGRFDGVLISEPVGSTSVRAGDTMTVPRDALTDWTFVEDGRLVGGYTVRVLFDRSTEEEKAAMREAMPIDW
jgi:uncharacterized protein YegJ (DUF2314 family)